MSGTRKVCIVFGLVAGAALAFVLCGGLALASAAVSAASAPAHQMTTAEYLAANGVR